jgi:hypothetical protein
MTFGFDTEDGVTHDLAGRVLAECQVDLLGGDRGSLGGLLPQNRAAGHHETAGRNADAAEEQPPRDAGALHILSHYCPPRSSRDKTERASQSGKTANITGGVQLLND